MMPVTKISAPFGTGVKKFGKFTQHPNLDPNGLYATRPLGCDPCLYHPKSLHEAFEVNKNRTLSKDPWRYKKELEDWAHNLGYRNQQLLKYRRHRQTILGPAWHEINEPQKYQPACKNLGFGRTPRFSSTKNKLPGPGTYYKANPFTVLYGPHSKRQTFEREEPCRFKDLAPPWSLAPNRYSIIDKDSIEMKSKRIVSLRGPYDLFSGIRDGNSIKNHFNMTSRCAAATWPLALPGSFEQFKKSHIGVMNKTNRSLPYRGRNAMIDLSMCVKKSNDPGPAHYDMNQPKVFKEFIHGFNSSYDRPPGYKRVVVWPGVGRYKPHPVSCGITGQGHKHVFLSKQGRTLGAILPQPMNSF